MNNEPTPTDGADGTPIEVIWARADEAGRSKIVEQATASGELATLLKVVGSGPAPELRTVQLLVLDAKVPLQVRELLGRSWVDPGLDSVEPAYVLRRWATSDLVWSRAVILWAETGASPETTAALTDASPPPVVRPQYEPALKLWCIHQEAETAQTPVQLSNAFRQLQGMEPKKFARELDIVLHRVLARVIVRAHQLDINWSASPLGRTFPSWLKNLKSISPYFSAPELKADLVTWQKIVRGSKPTATKPKSLNSGEELELRLRDMTLAERSSEIKARWAEGWNPERAVVTATGRQLLERKLVEMEQRLVAIRDEKKSSHDLSGDGWHDNPGLNQLRQVEERQMKDIAQMKSEITKALVIDPIPRPLDRVSVGSCVTFTLDGSVEEHCEIVGFGEEDPARHRVTYRSPLAEALRGLRTGEERTTALPSGNATYRVLRLDEAPADLLIAGDRAQ